MGSIKASFVTHSFICLLSALRRFQFIIWQVFKTTDHVDDQFNETICRIVLFSQYWVKQKISQVDSNALLTLVNWLVFSPCIEITLRRSIEIVGFGSFENYVDHISLLLRQREVSVDSDESRTSTLSLILFVHIIPSLQLIIPRHQNVLQWPIKVNILITKHHTVLWKTSPNLRYQLIRTSLKNLSQVLQQSTMRLRLQIHKHRR